jgi:TrmH family RNA methyltransferase
LDKIMIRSVANPRVAEWSRLLQKKGRDQQNRFLIEGIHLVQEALKSGLSIDCIVYSGERGWPKELERPHDVECVAVSENVMRKCTDTKTPQAVFAVLSKNEVTPDEKEMRELLNRRSGLFVVADRVQDPGNLGTIIRSADAVAADGVVIGKGSVDLFHPKTVRATMGSLFHLPIWEAELTDLLEKIRENGAQIVATTPQAKIAYDDLDWTKTSWVLIGNEGSGLSPEVRRLATVETVIPMPGKAESLNAGMAATVLLYEALRQRRKRG